MLILFFDAEDGGNNFLRNVGLPSRTTWHCVEDFGLDIFNKQFFYRKPPGKIVYTNKTSRLHAQQSDCSALFFETIPANFLQEMPNSNLGRGTFLFLSRSKRMTAQVLLRVRSQPLHSKRTPVHYSNVILQFDLT